MFETFFKWLRRKTADSVLAGVNDAAQKIQDEREEPGPPLLLIWQPQEDEKPKKAKAG